MLCKEDKQAAEVLQQDAEIYTKGREATNLECYFTLQIDLFNHWINSWWLLLTQ